MPAPTITKGEEHFFTTIYEGNGTGQRVGNFVPFTDSGTIANSCMFNNTGSASAHYLRNSSLSEGNNQIATFSAWIKFTGPFSTSSDLYTNNGGIIEQGNGNWTSTSHFMFWQNRGRLEWYHNGTAILRTNKYLNDSSKWYHIMWTLDVTQTAAADRLKFYIDGDEVTSFAVDARSDSSLPKDTDLSYINVSGQELNIGGMPSGNGYQDTNCYMAEVNYIDGTAYGPSTFGVTDTSTGRWIPKTLSGISYGTNGFRLTFADNSTDAAMGDDTSGNGNDLTPNNVDRTDQSTDSPTQNHATMSPSRERGSLSLSEGNLKMVSSSSGDYAASIGTLRISASDTTGFYCECKQVGSRRDAMSALIMRESVNVNGLGNNQSYTGTVGIKTRGSGGSNQYWYTIDGNEEATTGVSHALNDYVQIAVKEGKVWIGINNTWLKSGDPANGTNPLFDDPFGNEDFRIMFVTYQNNDLEINFGQKSFNHTPPTGFVAIQQDNLIETGKGIPDLVWAKSRDSSFGGQILDSSRGVGNRLLTSDTNTEAFDANHLRKFLKGGYETGNINVLNTAGDSMVAWHWIANNASTDTNNDGETTSIVQVNSTAKFSIGTFTSKTAEQTIGHGLGVAPDVIILKCRSDAQNWFVYHKLIDETDSHYLHLNTTGAEQTGSDFGNAVPTSSTFEANPTGTAGRTYCFWAFKGVDGFSKFGKYSGNGVANGAMVYTGFKPAWVMIKCYSTTGNGWTIHDNKRMPFNGSTTETTLYSDSTQVEQTSGGNLIDFLSNGFKLRGTNTNLNGGRDYVYFAFAEHPFIGDGTSPATAR